MRILVCGGRDLNEDAVWNWLNTFGHQDVANAMERAGKWGATITSVIHGNASGADKAAEKWAESEGIRVHSYPANWRKHGKAAGPMRNARMLSDGRPEVVIAFPGGRGTADMVRQAEAEGVPVVYPAALGFKNPL